MTWDVPQARTFEDPDDPEARAAGAAGTPEAS
jgi:hypothetical protein